MQGLHAKAFGVKNLVLGAGWPVIWSSLAPRHERYLHLALPVRYEAIDYIARMCPQTMAAGHCGLFQEG